MAKKRKRPNQQPAGAGRLELARKKLSQAEVKLAALRVADQNASIPTSDFENTLADYGVLIREIKVQLSGLRPRWDEWWNGRMAGERVSVSEQDRQKVNLVVDACDAERHRNGPGLRRTQEGHEFVGGLRVFEACDRAFGLMKEARRVLAEEPIP